MPSSELESMFETLKSRPRLADYTIPEPRFVFEETMAQFRVVEGTTRGRPKQERLVVSGSLCPAHVWPRGWAQDSGHDPLAGTRRSLVGGVPKAPGEHTISSSCNRPSDPLCT